MADAGGWIGWGLADAEPPPPALQAPQTDAAAAAFSEEDPTAVGEFSFDRAVPRVRIPGCDFLDPERPTERLTLVFTDADLRTAGTINGKMHILRCQPTLKDAMGIDGYNFFPLSIRATCQYANLESSLGIQLITVPTKNERAGNTAASREWFHARTFLGSGDAWSDLTLARATTETLSLNLMRCVEDRERLLWATVDLSDLAATQKSDRVYSLPLLQDKSDRVVRVTSALELLAAMTAAAQPKDASVSERVSNSVVQVVERRVGEMAAQVRAAVDKEHWLMDTTRLALRFTSAGETIGRLFPRNFRVVRTAGSVARTEAAAPAAARAEAAPAAAAVSVADETDTMSTALRSVAQQVWIENQSRPSFTLRITIEGHVLGPRPQAAPA